MSTATPSEVNLLVEVEGITDPEELARLYPKMVFMDLDEAHPRLEIDGKLYLGTYAKAVVGSAMAFYPPENDGTSQLASEDLSAASKRHDYQEVPPLPTDYVATTNRKLYFIPAEGRQHGRQSKKA